MSATSSKWVADPSAYKEIASELFQKFKNERIFCFYGEMGAGKTTFIARCCKLLGAIDQPSSPTFSIVNEYLTIQQNYIYHFDFYRIRNIDEAINIGIYDYLDSGGYCFIEWPEKIESILPLNCVRIKIANQGNGRTVTF